MPKHSLSISSSTSLEPALDVPADASTFLRHVSGSLESAASQEPHVVGGVAQFDLHGSIVAWLLGIRGRTVHTKSVDETP